MTIFVFPPLAHKTDITAVIGTNMISLFHKKTLVETCNYSCVPITNLSLDFTLCIPDSRLNFKFPNLIPVSPTGFRMLLIVFQVFLEFLIHLT